LLAAGVGLVTAFIAAALPAARAARTGIASTVRLRGQEHPGRREGTPWLLIRFGVLLAVAVCLVLQSIFPSAVWGICATLWLAIAMPLFAQPFVRLASPPLLRLFRRVGPTAFLAMKNVAESPRRTALTIGMIGVGVGAVLWLWAVAHSFELSVVDSVSQYMRSELTVTSSHVAAGFLEAPVTGQLLDEVRHVPGVASASAMRVQDWPYSGGNITLEVYDPDYFTSSDFGHLPLIARGPDDLWRRVSRGEALVISSSFQKNLGGQIGEYITLDTPHGALTLPIAGVASLFVSARGTVVFSRDLYRRYWDDELVTRVFVHTPTETIASTRAAIERDLGKKYVLRILSSHEIVDYFALQVQRGFAGLHIITIVIMCVVLVGMGDTLTAGIIERVREIGAIRVVGVRRGSVRRMVLLEAIIVGSLGIVLAIVTGAALGTLWIEATFPALLGYVLLPYTPYFNGLVLVVATMIVCLLAASIPARRAAHLEPATALRYE
ncbi:MAG TPA: ABC transporter permease, partial [Candidatus Acidoferrales bacterium]|nr:ABC transporter permease [Candidatus Acidoferrales bacterium]